MPLDALFRKTSYSKVSVCPISTPVILCTKGILDCVGKETQNTEKLEEIQVRGLPRKIRQVPKLVKVSIVGHLDPFLARELVFQKCIHIWLSQANFYYS